MKIYNTLTKQKEEFKPRVDGKISMFVCGPTVYDYIHIGNARTFVFFDVVAKYLRSQGYELNYIQNITDIDDKIIQRAKENNRDPLDWAKEYFEKFKKDMQSLKIDSAKYVPATEHINEVVAQVKKLIKKGHAYLIESDGYYFDLKTFPEYGKLSGRTAEMADDAVSRIDENDMKKNRGDFCVWKLSKEGEPAWDTEFGKGRPGWHIEDTAITEKYFGPQYDIHGGGQDLIFPHHEAEIAQQEAASDLKPFVKYWLHVAFLVNKDKKMSKSLGNFAAAHEMLQKYPPEVLRFYFLSAHYRSPLDYEDKIIKQAQGAVNRISGYYNLLQKISSGNGLYPAIDERINKFHSSMNDDLNTPMALAALFELINETYPLILDKKIGKETADKIIGFIDKINLVLGILGKNEIPDEVDKLVNQREQLRTTKNWAESDKIRAQINNLGYEIEDTVYGPLVIAIRNS